MTRPILIIEDDAALLRGLKDNFEAQHYRVQIARDGREGLAAVLASSPDLLVLDIAMPGLNGIAAAAQLKRRGSTAKVVFVTNMRDREFIQESLTLGQVGFVIKDRLVADLLPAVRDVLAGKSFVSPSVRH